jgi:hypothetical protein
LTPAVLAQGGKPKPGPKGGDDGTSGAEAAPVKINTSGIPKGVPEAIKNNTEKMKKECEKISGQIGAEFHGAQGPTVALYSEDPQDRVQKLVEMSESIIFDLSKDFQIDPLADLWAKRMGPFNMFHFKSKGSFTDACRGYLDKRFPSHSLGKNPGAFQDVGGYITPLPSPIACDWEQNNIESAMAHRIGQTFAIYVARLGPRFAEPKPEVKEGDGAPPTDPPKEPTTGDPPKPLNPNAQKEPEREELAWLEEGMAMYTAIRFTGVNAMFCITDTKYVGAIAIADKNRDTAYRLICIEIANGTEDKAKDFAQLTKTDLNALTFIDLAKSYSLFDWLMRAENRPKIVQTMKGMRGGVTFAASLKKATGWSMSEFESQWKKFVLDEYQNKGKKKPSAPTPDPKGKDPKKK